MKNPLKNIFCTLILIFILMVSYFVIPFAHEIKSGLFPYITILGFIFLLLGGLLIYFSYKLKIKGKEKWFLILTGAAPVVAFISVILHNLVYGLMIYLFGEGFWNGGDEAFFFILALIVCPIMFLVGVVGSMIMMLKEK